MTSRTIQFAIVAVSALAVTSPAWAQHDPGSRQGDQGDVSEELQSRLEVDEERLRDREDWQKYLQALERRPQQERQQPPDPRTAQAEPKSVRNDAMVRDDRRAAATPAGEATPEHEEMSLQEQEHLDVESGRKVDPDRPGEDESSAEKDRTAERIDQ